ncbi:hypothetical protein J3F83DRAFT_746181 [Trichoderma novae-zelandiae]
MSAPNDQNAASRDEAEASTLHVRALVAAAQQQRTRRRRGSLRKVALLGRGAQRDRRDGRPLAIDTDAITDAPISESARFGPASASASTVHNALGLDISPVSSPTSEYPCQPNLIGSSTSTACFEPGLEGGGVQADMYSFTTDEEDLIQLETLASQSLRSSLPLSSGSESYYAGRATTERRQKAKSPLSYSASTLPQPAVGWDYSETEWWGWVVLTVTWFVFVMGMGSCFDVWSWAWDVGKTPYAPPELEDDPTLPIVGYYPALITLTCVMAWVWVVVAWVGMKYFRHAKISGD